MKDKMTTGYQIEGLDRCHTILVMLEHILGVADTDDVHPSIYNKKCHKHLSKATQHVAALYQEVGAWEEE